MPNPIETPAYRIALVPEQLATLGEILVIIGQIDDDMTRSITGILGIDRPTANKLMWTQDAVDLWAGVLKGRNKHPHFDEALKLAASEVKSVLRDRNDFVHADYRIGFKFEGQFVTVRGSSTYEPLSTPMTAVASRSRDQKRRDVDELAGLRNRAARTSRLVAHVTHAVAPHGDWDRSPWLLSVEPFLAKSAGRTPRKDIPPAGLVQTFDGVRPTKG